MTRHPFSRRQFTVGLASLPALALLSPQSARAAGSVVAAAFPNAWEDAGATTSYVTQSVIGGARLIYLPQYVYREVGVLFHWPSAAAAAFVLLAVTGVVMWAMTAASRHPRLAGHA